MAQGDAREHPPPAPCAPRPRWPWPRSACWRCLPPLPPPPTSGQCPLRLRAPHALSPTRVPARPRTQPFAQAGPRSPCGRISLPELCPSLSELRLNLPFSSLPSLGPLLLPVPLSGGCQTPVQAWSSACSGDPGLAPQCALVCADQASVPDSYVLFRSFLGTLSVSILGSVDYSLLTISVSFAFPCRAGTWTPGWEEGFWCVGVGRKLRVLLIQGHGRSRDRGAH